LPMSLIEDLERFAEAERKVAVTPPKVVSA
jgi:hypothetical protein